MTSDSARNKANKRKGAGFEIDVVQFLRDHHLHVHKIAVVTDSHLGDAAEHIGAHFVAAEIRHFPADAIDEARAWISLREQT